MLNNAAACNDIITARESFFLISLVLEGIYPWYAEIPVSTQYAPGSFAREGEGERVCAREGEREYTPGMLRFPFLRSMHRDRYPSKQKHTKGIYPSYAEIPFSTYPSWRYPVSNKRYR